MSMQTDLFSHQASECNRVKIGGRTELLGNPKIKPEKPHTIIGFPGGDVEIARTSEGLYWVHVAVRDGSAWGAPTGGQIVRARLDAEGRYADAANATLDDELGLGDIRHIAFLIRPGTPRREGGAA